MKAGVGFSDHQDPFIAGSSAARKAIETSGTPNLLVVFTTDFYDPEKVLSGIKSIHSTTKIVGFCCGGIITKQGVHTQGIGICSLSGNFYAGTSLHKGLSQSPWKVGVQAGKEILDQGLEKGTILVLPDGFQANMSEMLRGLYSQTGPDFKYIGGGAGDNLKFFKTYQFTEKDISNDALALAIIDGLEISTGIGHGWKPIGYPLTINKVVGKTVFEIDNIPAFHAYSQRLGNISKEDFKYQGMIHPLGFPDIAGQYIIRDPISANGDDSITFVTEIPSQAVGNIMDCRIHDLIETARIAAYNAISCIKKPAFTLLFDCISRILLMEKQFQEEISAIQRLSGDNVPLLGALTFGEIGSYSDVPLLHNKTTVVAVGDSLEGKKNA